MRREGLTVVVSQIRIARVDGRVGTSADPARSGRSELSLVANRQRGHLRQNVRVVETRRVVATRCEEVDEVLRRCAAHLDQRMRTAAIHLAETPPPVLEVAAVLDFDGADAWREVCVENTLPIAPPIAAEIVSRLNEAYVREDSLADLLAEHRRVARVGTLSQRIQLLRQLIASEPENTDWQKDLRTLEKAGLVDVENSYLGAGRRHLLRRQSSHTATTTSNQCHFALIRHSALSPV